MTPRAIRRAQERLDIKLARKAAAAALTDSIATVHPEHDPLEELDFTPEPEACRFISAAQFAANRANAQLSTGATSPEGKAKVSLNAVKTGLTGRTVLLPGDDAAAYQHHVCAYKDELKPVGQRESDLVQAIADSAWRLVRIPGLEFAIYAQGRVQFANTFDNFDPQVRSSMIELETFIANQKLLRNLQLQESRLHRRKEKDLAELRQLQQERRAKELQEIDAAARQYVLAQRENKPFNATENGFEFSTAQIERYLATHSPSWLAQFAAADTAALSKAA